MLNKEKTPVNNEKNQRHFVFVLLLCRTKVEVHISNVPACSALLNDLKYSSRLSFCEVPVVPFAEPPSTVTPTMPMGCKSQDWQSTLFCAFSKHKSASRQTGKRGRASCEWGLIPSLRWPHFRVETQAPNLLFTHSNMFTALGHRNCQRHSQGLEKHPWGSARLVFVRSTASEWNSKHFRPVSASSTRIAVSRAAQEGDYTTHSLWLYQRNKLRADVLKQHKVKYRAVFKEERWTLLWCKAKHWK